MGKRRSAEMELTQDEAERLTEALKDDEFRKLLLEYCQETQSPEAKAKYQEEFIELEKSRGFLITFVNPQPGYVVKSSVAGERKAFINVCCNDLVQQPSYSQVKTGGTNWSVPYSLAPPREDYDKSKNRCLVYDIVFHSDALRFAARRSDFKAMLTQTSIEAIQINFKVILDVNNVKYPKSTYKGVAVPAVIRKPDPNFNKEDSPNMEFLDELYPQKCYSNDSEFIDSDPTYAENNIGNSEYTTPKYVIKQRREIEMKEYTYEKDAKLYSAIPSHLVIEVYLPLLSSSMDTTLDIKGKEFTLISEKLSKYKLSLNLPYNVDDDAGTAKFDSSKRTLVVTLPVIPDKSGPLHREDSGVESDINSPCGSDEDNGRPDRVIVLSEIPETESTIESEAYRTKKCDSFFDPSLSYIVPPHSSDVFDNLLIITIDVKNVHQESVIVEKSNADIIKLKFESIGAGFYPMYYGLLLKVPPGSKAGLVNPEVWDNNLVLQVEIVETDLLASYWIGLSEDEMIEYKLKNPMVKQNGSGIKFKLTDLNDFIKNDLLYLLPSYIMNAVDNMIALTFKIQDVDVNSYALKKLPENEGFVIKFSSGDCIKNHYSLCLKFPIDIDYEEPVFDVQKENAILRFEILSSDMPLSLLIGSDEENLFERLFESFGELAIEPKHPEKTREPIVEVMSRGKNETSILLSKYDKSEERIHAIPKRKLESFDAGICSSGGSFKGILKYRCQNFERSFSESHVDLIDCNSPSFSISSADCIPEESSSLKKTVRFSDVISKQTFRSNSSILGQKSKNQRKKRNKKRANDRRASEGDPDDSVSENAANDDVFLMPSARDKTAERKDSGLTDTDDGDSDKGDDDDDHIEITDKKFAFLNHKREQQGKYLDVNFKNDLIFDLDM